MQSHSSTRMGINMARKYRWRVVVTDGLDHTYVWFGMAANKAEAVARALEGRPGWHVQEAERAVTPF